jgi:PBP1b-binding outer membrane lipoprotein LpoB
MKHPKQTLKLSAIVIAILLSSCAERFTEIGTSKPMFVAKVTNSPKTASRRMVSPTITLTHKESSNTLAGNTEVMLEHSSYRDINPKSPTFPTQLINKQKQLDHTPLATKRLINEVPNKLEKPKRDLLKQPITFAVKGPKAAKISKQKASGFGDNEMEMKTIYGLLINILAVLVGAALGSSYFGDEAFIAYLVLTLVGTGVSIWGLIDLINNPYDYSYKFISGFLGLANVIYGLLFISIVFYLLFIFSI